MFLLLINNSNKPLTINDLEKINQVFLVPYSNYLYHSHLYLF